MSTLKNKSKSELIEEIESLKNQVQNFEGIERERTHTANELRESEEKFSKLFFDNPTPMIIINVKTGDRIDVNDSYVKMSGYDRNELLEGNINKKNLAFSQKRLKEIIRKTIKKGYVSNEYFQFVNKAGEIITTLLSGTKLNIGDGNKIVYSCLDVTEREENQRKLQESEGKYRELVEQSPTAIQIMTPDGWTIKVNSAFMKLWGYSEEALQKVYEKYNILQDEQARKLGIMPLIEKAFAGEVVFLPPLEYSPSETMETLGFTETEGRNRWIQPRLFPVKNKDGEIINLVLMMEDITERKHSGEALKESEEKYRELFEAESDAHFLIENETGNIIESNMAAEKLYGYTKKELAKKKNTDLSAELEKTQNVTEQTPPNKEDVVFIPLRYHKKKDGTLFPVEITGRFFTSKGKSVHIAAIRDISERKQSEEQLRESKYLLEQVLNTNPAIIFVKDKDSRILLANKTMADFYNLSIENVTGLLQSDLHQQYSPDQQEIEKWLADDREVIETGQSKNLEESGTDSNKFQHWFQTGKYPVNLSQNQKGVLVISEDITKHKSAEVALQESEKKFQDLYDNAPDMFVSVDAKTSKIKECNQTIIDNLGYSKEEILGSPIFKLYHTDSLEGAKRAFKKFIETGEVRDAELQLKRKDGSKINTSLNVSAVRDEEGAILYSRSVWRDITERKLAEDALKEQSYLNQQILETTLDGYILGDSDGKIIDVNPAYCDMIGYTSEELIGMNIREVEVKTPPEEVDRRIKQMVRTGGDRFETKHKHKDGHILDLDTSTSISYLDDAPLVAAFVRDITARKVAEEAIRKSENKFRNVLENIQLIGLMLDKNGRLNFANDFLLKLTGWKREEAIGKDWFENFLPDNVRANVKKMFYENINSGGFPQSYQNEIITKEGELKIISWSNSAHVDNNNKTYAVTSIGEDITERRQAEEALRESERKFREMADLSPIIVYEIDINRNLTFFNKRASAIFGFSEHDLMSKFNALDRVIPEDRDRARENIKKIMNGKSASNTEYTLIKKDGSTFPVLIYSNRVMKDNKPVGLRGIIIDMTERKQAEEALQESEEKFRNMFNESPIGIELYKADGMQLTANKASLNMFGIPDESEIYGFNIFDGSSLDVEKKEKLRRGETVEYQSAFDFEKVKELQRFKTDRIGIAYFDYIITPLLDKEKQTIQGYLLQVQDITERKKVERSLRNSRNQLRNLAERLQMIREEERATVAREIHDDLGQTLTALKMDISWMKKNAGMTEEIRAAKFDTMLGLTDSTIQTVKRIAIELRPGILDDLGLVSAIEWQTKEFQNRSGIECNFEISVDKIAIDEEISVAVFRIFQESLTNIARHSQATKFTVAIMRENDYLLVEISDNGVGISEEQISSSKSLGIIGMKERVSVFEGKLKISKEAGGGTTVRVYIPIGKE